MTEIDIRQPVDVEQHRGAAPTTKLGRWAQDARDAHLVAQSLSRTCFVPKEMQGKPELVTAAILTGQELGLDPMAALRSIDVIQGTPAMRANSMRGLVQSHGHEVWADDTNSQTRAIVYGRRNGSDIVQKSEWTIDRAKQMGLTNKDNYRKQPGAMLVARATAEVCRLIASDVLLGMPYAVEELDEGGEVQATEAEPKSTTRRTARRRPIASVPAPVEEPEDVDEPEPPASSAADDPSFDFAPQSEWPEVKRPGNAA